MYFRFEVGAYVVMTLERHTRLFFSSVHEEIPLQFAMSTLR